MKSTMPKVKLAPLATIEVGDHLKDNDPRMSYRGLLTVTELHDDHVVAKSSSGALTFKYKRTRIHTDGKARKSGLSLIRAQQ